MSVEVCSSHSFKLCGKGVGVFVNVDVFNPLVFNCSVSQYRCVHPIDFFILGIVSV